MFLRMNTKTSEHQMNTKSLCESAGVQLVEGEETSSTLDMVKKNCALILTQSTEVESPHKTETP